MENNTNIKVSTNGDVTITTNGVERKFDNSSAVDIFVDLLNNKLNILKLVLIKLVLMSLVFVEQLILLKMLLMIILMHMKIIK